MIGKDTTIAMTATDTTIATEMITEEEAMEGIDVEEKYALGMLNLSVIWLEQGTASGRGREICKRKMKKREGTVD